MALENGRESLNLDSAPDHEAADKRIDILRRIGDVGSISEAARGAGVSYKAAWQAIDTLSNPAGEALVDSSVGGAGGGGARLTDAGRRLLAAADEITKARRQVLARLAGRKGSGVQLIGVAALGLRTSMRNQQPCTVKALAARGPMVRVEMLLPDGAALASRITRESAELLALAPGLAVIALCKATAVRIGTGFATGEGRNQFSGRVARGSRDASGSAEVTLKMDAGLNLVGFADAASGLKTGSAALAEVDETAVVISVPG